ncbi:MAG: caspase family protein, partial [Propylenella sp.]
LRKAVNDANAVGDTLEELGFEVTRGENVSRGEMLAKLVLAADSLQPGDIAFFFYAGHGVSIDGANYLLPADIPSAESGGENLIKYSGIPEAMVVETLKARGVRVAMVVLDACRNNPFSQQGTRAFGDAARGLTRPPAVQTQGLFGLYSAGFGEQALDRLSEEDADPNSVFTRILVPTLKKSGLSLIDVAYQVNEEVARLARSVGHDQNPAYYDQARGRDVFLAGPGDVATGQEGTPRTQTTPDSCASAQLHFEAARDLNRVEALEDHITRFGDCQFAALARMLIEGLKEQESVEKDVAALAPATETETGRSDSDDPHILECERQATPAFDQMDTQTAISACQLAVERAPESARAKYLLGRAYDADQNATEAVNHYRAAAEAGLADAQFSLALKYDTGDGIVLDDVEAMKWYTAAAEQGLANAQHYLGLMYDFGEGVAESDVEAAKWYRAAADQGSAEAQNRLGLKYDYGEGVELNDQEAVRWYRAAADQNLAAGQHNLGLMYDFGEGVEKDPAEAVRWIRLAAENGYADAQAKLGEKYSAGEGVELDYAEAAKWYQLGADQGHASSQNGLALLYDTGNGVPLDDAEAARLYRLAADQGLAVAQYNLALMYDSGEGVAQDYTEAVNWFRKASDQDYAAAYNMLGLKYDLGQGVDLDDVEAVRLYRLAAEKGVASGQYNLGLMYDYGEGVDQDENEACGWYRTAADQEHANAQWQVGRIYALGRCGTGQDLSQASEYFLKALSLGSTEAQSELIDNRAQSLDREARRAIQRTLSERGEYTGAIDGAFGSGTITALQSYAGG